MGTAQDTATSTRTSLAAAADDTGAGIAERVITSCGGASFTAATRVRTASGALVAISRLRKGEKVLATITRTGKTGPAAVTAVLLHYDKDLLDLEISVDGRIAVIRTTSSHLFWDLTQGGG